MRQPLIRVADTDAKTGPDPNELADASATPDPPCRYLRSAGMYLYTDGSRDESSENYESSSYWCSATMKCFGPDDDMVGGRECRNPTRPCYEAL